MSTLKSNNENMTINADGASSEIILQQNGTEIGRIGSGFAGTSGQVLTSNGAGSAPTMQDAAGGGKVLQVVNATYSTSTSTTSTSLVSTGLTASITPSSTSSTVLVTVCLNGVAKASAITSNMTVNLQRDSTSLINFEKQALENGGSSVLDIGTVGTTYEDSPSKDTSTTYTVRFSTENGNTLYTHWDGCVSTITLMEIGA